MSMSFLEAAYLVLKKTKRSIHYQDLMARIMDLDLVTTRGLTPSRTLNSILNVECKRPQSRFCSFRSGYFGLKECGNIHEPPPEVEKKARARNRRKDERSKGAKAHNANLRKKKAATKKAASKAKGTKAKGTKAKGAKGAKKASPRKRKTSSAKGSKGAKGAKADAGAASGDASGDSSGSYSSMSSESRHRALARRRRREARLLRQERRRLEAAAAAAAAAGAANPLKFALAQTAPSNNDSADQDVVETVVLEDSPIEYTIDATDSAWISDYNASGRGNIDPKRFEFFMDRFEKGTNSDTELMDLSVLHFPEHERFIVEDVYSHWLTRRRANGGRPLLASVKNKRFVASQPGSPRSTSPSAPFAAQQLMPASESIRSRSVAPSPAVVARGVGHGRHPFPKGPAGHDPSNIVSAAAAILSRPASLVPASVAYRSNGDAPLYMAPSDVVSAVPSGAQTPIGGVDFGASFSTAYRFDYCSKCFGTSSVPSNKLVMCGGPCSRWFHEICAGVHSRDPIASSLWRCPDCKAANASPTGASSHLGSSMAPSNSTLSMINFEGMQDNPLTSNPGALSSLGALGVGLSTDPMARTTSYAESSVSGLADFPSTSHIHHPSAYAEFMDSIIAASEPSQPKRKSPDGGHMDFGSDRTKRHKARPTIPVGYM